MSGVVESRVQGPKFLRKCQILVGKDGDGKVDPQTGLLIENAPPKADGTAGEGLHIKFEISKTIYRTPNTAIVQIFNLNQTHEEQVRKEYNDLIIQAGYMGGVRMVFRGNIRFSSFFREGNDRIAQINAGDGDKDFTNALVNFTLEKTHADEMLFGTPNKPGPLLKSFRATTMGHVHGKNLKQKKVRGRTYVGTARDVLDRIARDNDAHWSIQDGALILVPVDSVLPNEAIEVSSETGLLGAPEATDSGVTIKVMMDPRILPGGKLWLRNNEVRQKAFKYTKGTKKKAGSFTGKFREDPDGVYKVYAVKHVGDTRGGDWYSECKCVGLSQKIPPNKGLMPRSTTDDGDIL